MTQAPEATTPTKPRRRWYQFSLRTLLVAMVVLRFGFTWAGLEVKRALDQRAAVQAIRAAGGGVEFGEPRWWFARQEWIRSLEGVKGILIRTQIGARLS